MVGGELQPATTRPSIDSCKRIPPLRAAFRSSDPQPISTKMESGLRFRSGGDDKVGKMPALPLLIRQQIFKRQLCVVSLHVVRPRCARNVERLAHSVEVKADDARSQTHGR